MAQMVFNPRPSPSTSRVTTSSPGYFEFNPSLQSETALIKPQMGSNVIAPGVAPSSPSNTVRLDAFHVRAPQDFDMPENTSIYAKRALPALPRIQTSLKKPSASLEHKSPASTTSFSYPRRPSLYTQGRTITTDCCERSVPAVSTSAPSERVVSFPSHQRVPSCDSVASSKSPSTYEVDSAQLRRPRHMRSTSFRNFFNRNTYPGGVVETQQRSTSSMSQTSDVSVVESCVDSVLDDPGLCLSKSGTPISTAPSSRRPSTLSLVSLRPRKASTEIAPLALRQPALRKNSKTGSTSRWNIFGTGPERHSEDEEVAISPSAAPIKPMSELSCVRCYYFSARNCNGWIMGGSHGEACDTCTVCFLACTIRKPSH